MRRGFLALSALGTLSILSGCHIDMWQQPKAKSGAESDFFKDRSASRPFVEGTVPVGGLRLDRAYFEGKGPDGKAISQIPPRAVEALGGAKEFLERGENRYNVYCTPCHGPLGDGNGFVTQRGLGYWQKVPASLHTPQIRKRTDGEIYNTIVHGKGVMYGYGARLPETEDRWAVVGYVRVLQRAQGGTEIADAPVPAPAPAEAAPVAAAQVQQAQEDVNTALAGLTGDVLFDTGKTDLKPAARTFLDKLGAVLKKYPAVQFEVGGHTDSQGNAEKNMTLSEGRARAVRSYLVSRGASDAQLAAKGYGQTKPVADNGSAEGRAKNRRISFDALRGTR
jgi:outer membrane protein OmpA-like peptidoglycan-associated protein